MCKHMAAVLYDAFSGDTQKDGQHPLETEENVIVTEQTGIRLFSIHIDAPTAVLGNRSEDQSVRYGADLSFDFCIVRRGNLKGG